MTELLGLYLKLGGGVALGFALGRWLPAIAPQRLGKFLFWIGVPIGCFAFVRRADLSGAVWLAPVVAWGAIALGAAAMLGWLRSRSAVLAPPTQGSFLLAAMFGNTGYLGFPVSLTLADPTYFGWALFYDLVGTTIGAYGLGAVLGARFSAQVVAGQSQRGASLRAVVINPALWATLIGMLGRSLPFPERVEAGLQTAAWSMVALSLVLIGMRLGQLRSWGRARSTLPSLLIKMVLVPLAIGGGLVLWGLPAGPRLVLVLQMAMPPAFATLVLAEAYDLDRELAVTTLMLGTGSMLLLLPVWVWLFG